MVDVAKLTVQVGADIGDAQKGLKQVHSDVQNTTTSMNSLGSAGAMALGGALVVGAAAAAAGIGYAVKSAMEFEKTMSGVKAVSGATATEMTQLNNLALQLGKDTVFSATEAGKGLEELVKGGVKIEDIMGGAAKAVLNLASAGGIDLPSAAEIAANAMSMFNLTGADMAHVTDQIAGAANASSLGVNDFRLSLTAVGSVANLAGQSFDSTATAIALMGAAGIKGSDAGTSLKTMLLNLQPATKAAKEEFEKLGITTDFANNKFIDANGSFRSMGEISGVLQTALSGLTDADRTMALQTMFGTDAVRAGAVMSKAGSEGFDTMAASMSKVTAESVAAEKLNNLTGDIEQAKGSAETFAITLGTSLTPELRTVTQAGTAFINDAIEKLPGTIEAARVKISDLQRGLEYYTGATTAGTTASKDLDAWLHNNSGSLENAAAAVSGLTTVYILLNAATWAGAVAMAADTAATWLGCAALDAMSIAQGALNVMMAANPIGIVIVALVALTSALVVAYNTSDDFKRIVDAGMAGAQAAIGGMVSAAQSALSGLGSAISGISTAIGNLMAAIGNVPSSVNTNVNTTYSSSGGDGGGGSHDPGGSAYNAWVEGGSFDPTNSGAGWGYNAAGTDSWRGGSTWVGERGPELLNLPRGSQIIPNDRATAGGGVIVNINNPTFLTGDRLAARELARLLQGELSSLPAMRQI